MDKEGQDRYLWSASLQPPHAMDHGHVASVWSRARSRAVPQPARSPVWRCGGRERSGQACGAVLVGRAAWLSPGRGACGACGAWDVYVSLYVWHVAHADRS